MNTVPRAADLPASTLTLLEVGPDGPFPVKAASSWADAMIGLGVETTEIFDLYALDDSQGHDCAKIIRQILTSIGTWPESLLGQAAICRDIALGALLRRDITPEHFSMLAAVIAKAIQSSTNGATSDSAVRARHDMQAFLEIDMIFACLAAYEPGAEEDAMFEKFGIDPNDQFPGVVNFLRKRGMIDDGGTVSPVTWGVSAPA